jgi:uncharacterized protein (DUF2236 family)
MDSRILMQSLIASKLLPAAITLPTPLQRRLETAATLLMNPDSDCSVDFTAPIGEPALTAPDLISWLVFKNPLALFVGGIAAVLLELAEPRVRAGVWNHSTFKSDPLRRIQRTGLAAMITVYGPRNEAETLITRVRRIHAAIRGVTPDGQAYHADDPRLLAWRSVRCAPPTASGPGCVKTQGEYVFKGPLTIPEGPIVQCSAF